MKPRKVGKKHRIRKEEAIDWAIQKFGVTVSEEEE